MARPALGTREISGEIPLNSSHIIPSLTEIEDRFKTRMQPRTPSSMSCSSQSMSASSSSTFSSSYESASHDAVTVVSMTSFGTPVISVGHISEDTDLEALAIELERYSGMAHASTTMPFSSSRSLYSGDLRSQRKIHSEALDSAQNIGMVHPASARITGLKQNLEELTKGDTKWHHGASHPSQAMLPPDPRVISHSPELTRTSSGVSGALSQTMAVLVDTDNGNRKRASKARPTLAQTLSSLQILSGEGGSGVSATKGEQPQLASTQDNCLGGLSQSLPSEPSLSARPLAPTLSSTQHNSKSGSQIIHCPTCRRLTETKLPTTSRTGQHRLAEACPQAGQINDKSPRRLSPPKEVRFLDGS